MSTAILYYTRPELFSEPAELARLRTLLSSDELARVDALRFEHDRHDRLIARALVRTALSSETGVDPAAWRFTANEYGRPEIDHPAEHRGLRFNLSHAEGLIVLLVAQGREVGIDVEPVGRETRILEIANHFFAPSEAAALAKTPEACQRRRFFQFWTLKESYIKAKGMGLSIPLKHFAFEIEDSTPETIRATFSADLEPGPDQWQFRLENLSPDHIVATTIEREPGASVTIASRELSDLR